MWLAPPDNPYMAHLPHTWTLFLVEDINHKTHYGIQNVTTTEQYNASYAFESMPMSMYMHIHINMHMNTKMKM
jgi:hypothetical protein